MNLQSMSQWQIASGKTLVYFVVIPAVGIGFGSLLYRFTMFGAHVME